MTAVATATSRFAYQARDQRGQVVNGFVNAATLVDATKTLRAEGKYIVDIKPAKGSGGGGGGSGAGGGSNAATIAAARGEPPEAAVSPDSVGRHTKIRREELIHFTMQLSVMVDTGVPLSEAIHSLSEQAVSETFAAVCKSIDQDVTGGKDFSSTIERFPRIFPNYYVSLVRASEISGTMGAMLRKLAEYLVSQRDMTKKVKGALIYPAFMFVMSVSVTIFLLVAVLPKFTAIFASRKAALPMPTQVLMAVSHSLLAYWYVWIIAAGLILIGALLLLK